MTNLALASASVLLIGVLLMSNAESIFGHLLTLTIADTFTPLAWENYVPYDRAPSAAR